MQSETEQETTAVATLILSRIIQAMQPLQPRVAVEGLGAAIAVFDMLFKYKATVTVSISRKENEDAKA